MKLRFQLLIVLLSLSMASCQTLTNITAGAPVPVSVYNREVSKQGSMYFCADGVCDRSPMLVSASSPKYPAAELLTGKSGQAVIDFYIDKDGSVSNAKIESATLPDFGIAAIRAVKSWKFKPATLKGEPVRIGPVRQIIPFVYH